MSRLRLQADKYLAVGKITVRNNLAYVHDFVIRSLFLLVILYIFVQLWAVTFESTGENRIAGYSYEQIIWYLIFAEAVIMASPRLSMRIEEEVKKGDIGYQLTRPVSYLWFQYAQYMGEAFVRLPVNVLVGGALGVFLFGWPDLGLGWIGFFLIAVGAFTVNFLLSMSLALCAFWVEEVRGLEFVYNKLLFTIGGMMLPLETFPDFLRTVCEWLPFQGVVYFAAKSAVHFEWITILKMVLIQGGWTILLSFLLYAVYRKGVRRLNVNGG